MQIKLLGENTFKENKFMYELENDEIEIDLKD